MRRFWKYSWTGRCLGGDWVIKLLRLMTHITHNTHTNTHSQKKIASLRTTSWKDIVSSHVFFSYPACPCSSLVRPLFVPFPDCTRHNGAHKVMLSQYFEVSCYFPTLNITFLKKIYLYKRSVWIVNLLLLHIDRYECSITVKIGANFSFAVSSYFPDKPL